MNIFIYRPDKMQAPEINPDLCYTTKGQSLREWQRDRDEVYSYRIEQIKRKLHKKPVHKVEDYWR